MRTYRGIVEEHHGTGKAITKEQLRDLAFLLRTSVDWFLATPTGREVLESKRNAWGRFLIKQAAGKDSDEISQVDWLVHGVICNPVGTLEDLENRIFIQNNLGEFADRLCSELRKKQFKHRRKIQDDFWRPAGTQPNPQPGSRVLVSAAEMSRQKFFDKEFLSDAVLLTSWVEGFPYPGIPPLCFCSDAAAASVIANQCKHAIDDLDQTTLRAWIRRWKLIRPSYFLLRGVRWSGNKLFLS